MSISSAGSAQPDDVALSRHYHTLRRGQQGALRRAADLNDLTLQPTLYALFPGLRPGLRQRRVAFFLPWVAHPKGAVSLPLQCARRGIRETRFLPVVRLEAPDDLRKLRRLLAHLRTPLDWTEFGPLLWGWGQQTKRTLMETYYLTLHTSTGRQRTR
jgi:CRISPR type I-E-associated protein CasB/Cse2